MGRVLRDQKLDLLLPHLASVTVADLRLVGAIPTITATTVAESAPYPTCGVNSRRVRDRYRRRLADVAAGGRPARIYLTVRRLRCEVWSCPRCTFAEQVKGLTFRYGRAAASTRRQCWR
ncbi:transposase family protein [Streptomyces sp. SGAir0957]